MQGLLRSTPPGLLTQFILVLKLQLLLWGYGDGALESDSYQTPCRLLSDSYQIPVILLSDPHQIPIRPRQIPVTSLSDYYQIPIKSLSESQ